MQKFLTILSLLILASCSQPNAQIVNKGSAFYGKNSASSHGQYSSINPAWITVSSGDTLYSISKQYNVSLRDLIHKNNISAPYFLRPKQRIFLPSNQYHQVVSGDTLYGISRQYGMNINKLIELNAISAPYSIMAGTKLLVNGSQTSKSSAKPVSVAYSKAKKSSKSGTKFIATLSTAPAKTPTKSFAKPVIKPSAKYSKEIKVTPKNNRFAWPIRGQVISKFGPKAGGLYNDGINIKASAGQSIKSTEDGIVAYVGDELRGYGNLIIIKHAEGWISAYGHLSSTKVNRGEDVKKGQTIGGAGSTGNVKSTQLYFGLRKGREAVNPQLYL